MDVNWHAFSRKSLFYLCCCMFYVPKHNDNLFCLHFFIVLNILRYQ